MPEFVLEGRARAAHVESDFVLGYIEAMFFTESAHGESMVDWFADETQERLREGQLGGELPGDAGYLELHPSALRTIRKDCEAFQLAARDLLALAYERDDYDESQAGRDFWFTRNGHGVGYWDRKQLEPETDEYERLTAVMIEANGQAGDYAAWDAALSKRQALSMDSLGNRLSALCGWKTPFGESHVWFGAHVENGNAPFVYHE